MTSQPYGEGVNYFAMAAISKKQNKNLFKFACDAIYERAYRCDADKQSYDIEIY